MLDLSHFGSSELYAMSDEPIFNLPDKETTLEEMEEMYSALMRQYDAFLENGETAKANEILEKAKEIEDAINDLEYGE